MNISDFDYILPKELIAQFPASPRDHSRLLVIDRKSACRQAGTELTHKHFYDIVNYLGKNDVFVLNKTKVSLPVFSQKRNHKEKLKYF